MTEPNKYANDLKRINEMLGQDVHCRKVSSPRSTQVSMLPAKALAAVKKQLGRG